jgi:hypothetical protein
MQKGHLLQFACQACQCPIYFSVFHLEKNEDQIFCPDCSLTYDFKDETLRRQLRQFESLCRQIQLSEEILGDTYVGIYVGDREVKIPYKILLTRLNPSLDLMLGDQPLTIQFRIEPAHDIPLVES